MPQKRHSPNNVAAALLLPPPRPDPIGILLDRVIAAPLFTPNLEASNLAAFQTRLSSRGMPGRLLLSNSSCGAVWNSISSNISMLWNIVWISWYPSFRRPRTESARFTFAKERTRSGEDITFLIFVFEVFAGVSRVFGGLFGCPQAPSRCLPISSKSPALSAGRRF